MRTLTCLALAAALAAPLAPAAAKPHPKYEYNGRYYNSYEQCRAAKRHAANRGTVIGAVAGGAGMALLGGDVGTSLLGAGVGAVAGHEIGRGGHKC
jgi:hypothetical protein